MCHNRRMRGIPTSRRWKIAPFSEYRGLGDAERLYLRCFDNEWAGTTSRLTVHRPEHKKALNKATYASRYDALALPAYERRVLFSR